ncbi:MAG: hypothetical protein K8E66_00090, partial [Phycisphaerales bacterium]|nr:hypothetical protein [Phycisphaerales bacterium]
MKTPASTLAVLLTVTLLSGVPACTGGGGGDRATRAEPTPRVKVDRRAEAQDAAANATRLKAEGVTDEA